MKTSELRDKTEEELGELEKDLREKLIQMRVAKATSRRVDTAQFNAVRKDIARIHTLRSERRLGLTRE